MNMDHRLEASHDQETRHTGIILAGDQLARRYDDSPNLTDVKGHNTTHDQYQNTGVVTACESKGGYGGQHSAGQNLDRSFHEDSYFRMTAGADDQLHVNLDIGRGNPNGGGAPGTSSTGDTPDSCEERRVADTVKQSDTNQQQIGQTLRNYRGGKGGAQPSGGLINTNLGYNGVKTYTAEHGQGRGVDTARGNQEAARIERTFAGRGSRAEQTRTDNQSAQSGRHSRDAALANMGEVPRVHDVSDRREFGADGHTNHSDSNSFTTHKDLMIDPYLFEKVAARDSTTAMRFANQSGNRITNMVQDYVSGKDMVQRATTIPQQTLADKELPATKGRLGKRSAGDHAGISQNIQGVHEKEVIQAGYSGTAPLKVDTSAPPIIAESRGDVQGQLDPKDKGNIPTRAGASDENVNAWTGPDKTVGAGQVNPTAVNEDNAVHDSEDTIREAWDKLTDGDGTADGGELNDNIKRETAALVRVDNDNK